MALPDHRQHWALDPNTIFLNHGSFGACPTPVLAAQTALRERLESRPVRFMLDELPTLLDAARAELAAFVGADPDDLVFVRNATSGVNAVVRSLQFAPGDELLTTDHAYAACRNAVAFVAEQAGARMVVARVPFPLRSPEQVTDAVLEAVTPRTKLALIDHVTSPTALIFPVEVIVKELAARGIDTIVDGAHVAGMLPLDLRALGAAYYTGNLHKWLCTPKGAAFLHVRRDRQDRVRPLTISHGATSSRTDRSRFQLEFDWTGTDDPTPALCVGPAMRLLGSLYPGGLGEHMARNRALAVLARDMLARALDVPPPCPDSMLGSMASMPLPDADLDAYKPPLYQDPLQEALVARGIEPMVTPFPAVPRRLLRVCAQAYNHELQYEALATTLRELLTAR